MGITLELVLHLSIFDTSRNLFLACTKKSDLDRVVVCQEIMKD